MNVHSAVHVHRPGISAVPARATRPGSWLVALERRRNPLLYLRLALQNLKFNWYRTRLAVLGVALATVVMVGSMSIQTGYPVQRAAPWRTILGGDIVAYSTDFLLRPGSEAGAPLQWTQLPETYPASIGLFASGLHSQGYFKPRSTQPEPFSENDVQALTRIEGVTGVHPYYAFPGFVGENNTTRRVRLRARTDFAAPEQAGRIPVWVNASTQPGVQPGDRLTLALPCYRGLVDGLPVYDYSSTVSLRVYVADTYRLPTGEDAPLYNADNTPRLDAEGQPTYVPVFWNANEVFLQQQDVPRVFALINDTGQDILPVYELEVTVDHLFYARTIADRVQSTLKHGMVFTVPELIDRMKFRVRAIQTGDGIMYVRRSGGQPVLPADLHLAVVALAFLVAGMLLMANMNVLVTERRTSLGILKALGTSSREIGAIILGESTIISVVGAILGLVAFTPLLVLLLLNTDAGPGAALAGAATTFATVVGTAVVVGVVFGTVPAWRAARETVAELLS